MAFLHTVRPMKALGHAVICAALVFRASVGVCAETVDLSGKPWADMDDGPFKRQSLEVLAVAHFLTALDGSL